MWKLINPIQCKWARFEIWWDQVFYFEPGWFSEKNNYHSNDKFHTIMWNEEFENTCDRDKTKNHE